jgi:hypothetical protein
LNEDVDEMGDGKGARRMEEEGRSERASEAGRTGGSPANLNLSVLSLLLLAFSRKTANSVQIYALQLALL